MKRSTYEQLHDGDWFRYDPALDIACCDCGLVHRLKLRVKVAPNGKRIIDVKLQLKPRATAALRRHHAHKCGPVKRAPKRAST